MSRAEITLYPAEILELRARELRDVVALTCGSQTVTFSELQKLSQGIAGALLASDLEPGDRIAILARNGVQWFPIFFGSALARTCLVPINARLAAPEISYILRDAGAKLLFVDHDLAPLAAAAVSDLPAPPTIIALDSNLETVGHMARWLGAASSCPSAPGNAEDEILQLYTSGTTGKPKGVVLSNRNYGAFFSTISEVEGFSYATGETVMVVMPLFHVAGVNAGLAGLAQGCRVIIMRDLVPDEVVTTMQAKEVAHIFLAPTIIQMMLRTPAMKEASFPALRTISYGSSPISEDTLKLAQTAFGCDFVQFYGMTESNGAGTYLPPRDHAAPELLTSCGKPWPAMEVAIIAPDGTRLPAREIGEIAIRGDVVTAGYWHLPEASSAAIVDGWLRTGDAGYVDERGYFYVHDRLKDMIVSGGENVYPAEVEGAFFGCPGVAEVAVIGVPDERWGEAVKAIIVADGDQPDLEEVSAWVRQRIAAFKVPKSFEFAASLPRNATGKVMRRALREPFWEGRGRHVN